MTVVQLQRTDAKYCEHSGSRFTVSVNRPTGLYQQLTAKSVQWQQLMSPAAAVIGWINCQSINQSIICDQLQIQSRHITRSNRPMNGRFHKMGSTLKVRKQNMW